MRILTVHNKYKIRGGEDESREAEDAVLRSRGIEVREVVFDNDAINGANAALVGIQTTWNQDGYRRVNRAIADWRPDVLDVNNFFPLASPSIYYAANRSNVPVIQTLRNYRLICPGGCCTREGKICELCVGKAVPWPGILYGCYRGSRFATASVAAMISIHNLLGTWKKSVCTYIALTQFAKRKFVDAGFPADRIVVKPNFVQHDLGEGSGKGGYVLYVGRLAEQKGIHQLLSAWRSVGKGKLIIAGDGELRPLVEKTAQADRSIEYLGVQPLRRVYELMGEARALVFPSTWYEGMPRTVIESFSRGTPVISSRLGSMEEMIREAETGWFVTPGIVEELSAKLARVFSPSTDMDLMRKAARSEYERKYTMDIGYTNMMTIYNDTVTSYARSRIQ